MPEPSEPQVYFEQLFATIQAAAGVVATSELRYELAGLRVTVHLVGSALVPLITRALSHLRADIADAPDLHVYVADGAALRAVGIDWPATSWEHYGDLFVKSYGTQGEIAALNNERFGLIHNRWFGQIHMLDRQRNIGVVWYDDAAAQPYWEKTIPLRAILHLWTRNVPFQLAHSAAVGLAQGGVMITGRSGSGKSTTTLACLANDSGEPRLLFVGDDYVAVRLDATPYVFSLYQLGKLENDNLSRFPQLQRYVINPDRLDDEKALLSLLDAYPQAVVSGFPLRAILVPRITGQRDSRITRGSGAAALQALAPTSLFQLIGSKRIAFRKLQSLVRRIPVYTLEAGTDLAQIPQIIKSFLRAELST